MDLRTKERVVVEALEDVKGYDIQVFNTARLPSMFERVVIATGTSNTQVRALAERVQERILEQGSRVYGVEGESSGEWVLVDLGDVVVHIMHPTVRRKSEPKAPKKKAKAKAKAKARAKAPRRRAKR
jgi:ribosome-associated protein